MVTADQLADRKAVIAGSADLTALEARLRQRADPVIRRMPPIPGVKALLSREGGVCPHDGAPLIFDPWSPDEHRCPKCGRIATGERHQRHWARFQHLWLAERAAHLATVGVLADDAKAIGRASEILAGYETLYFELPNADNVLGPTHLFFSTYLESIWILNYVAAASILRDAGGLDQAHSAIVDAIANEAANVIGDFNEGFSNRQTWHAAALTAIAAWFGDEELAESSIQARTGLLGHLADGFGADGTWYEGENYHLFALRGLLTGLGWARSMGVDLLEDPAVADHLRLALMAPARTALPDFTFPARKDSRFGVSLAQPMYLELWEVGQGMLGAADDELAAWLSALYRTPVQPALTFDSYLHEAGEAAPVTRSRADLSWWSLLTMTTELNSTREWSPESQYFRSQGLAILRRGSRYVSLEAGSLGGGHGHPDRLHLTVHGGDVHWLPDFGTGSYVSRDLFWYRSTLAHNAPLLNGVSQPSEDASCEMFETRGEWGWTRGRFRETVRTIVAGPLYVLDVVTYSGDDPAKMELPWHLSGAITIESPGRWEPAAPGAVTSEFVRQVERFVSDHDGAVVLHGIIEEAHCRIHLLFSGDLFRARAPGIPDSGESWFLLTSGHGNIVRTIAVIDLSPHGAVEAVAQEGDVITVRHTSMDRHAQLAEGWQINTGAEEVRLGGPVAVPGRPEPIVTRERPDRPSAVAPWIEERPALDGSSEGFDQSEPLTLDTELQYRRSEEPWAGPEYFSAAAWINWSDDELFLLVEVTKSDLWFRPSDAAPMELDNEVDAIHSDGIQVYLQNGEAVHGFLVLPDPGGDGLQVFPAGESEGKASMVTGAWTETPDGYRISLGLRPGFALDSREELRFDLLVNEMRPGRQRRAGQLVWSGGNGWVYLRGDRQSPASFGDLTLVN
jgi:Heparinase II/III-like protein/Alginate lyase